MKNKVNFKVYTILRVKKKKEQIDGFLGDQLKKTKNFVSGRLMSCDIVLKLFILKRLKVIFTFQFYISKSNQTIFNYES